jgi:hypothetical protein
MVKKCPSGKKAYATQLIAEDILIELWTKNEYAPGKAPVTVYKCEDCGLYHLTSSGLMNDRLKGYINSAEYKVRKEASRWEDRLKR